VVLSFVASILRFLFVPLPMIHHNYCEYAGAISFWLCWQSLVSFLWFIHFCAIFRPPDIVVGGLNFTTILPSSSSIFFRYLPSELAERNSTKTSHVLGSDCSLKMHVRNLGYTLPLQIVSPKTTVFDDFAT